MVSGLTSATYEDKLKELNPQSLEDLRVRFDMIQVFKIMNCHDTGVHIISKIAGFLNPKTIFAPNYKKNAPNYKKMPKIFKKCLQFKKNVPNLKKCHQLKIKKIFQNSTNTFAPNYPQL